MIKKILLTTLLILGGLFSAGELRGQTIEIGSDQSTATSIPVATKAFTYSLSEQIYTVSEITGATGYANGQISKIWFKSQSALSRKIDIYIKHTTKSSFSSSTDWIPVLSTDLRYTSGGGTVSFVANDWTEITLDTPFEYDGTSNILVIVDDNTGESVSDYVNFYTYTGTSQTNFITATTNTNIDPFTTTSGSSKISKKNHIQLTLETITYPKPIAPTTSAITNRTASISWTNPTATTGYTLEGYQYKYTIIGTNTWSSTTTIGTTNSCSLESLSGGADYAFVVRAIYTDSSKETHYSDWAEVDFKTDCDAVDLEDDLTWGFEGSSSLPDCWKIAASYTSGNSTYPQMYTGSSSNAHTGQNSVRFCNTFDQVVLMPAYNQLNGKTLKYFAKASSSTGNYTITIGYYNSLGEFTTITNDFTITNNYPSEAFHVTFTNLPNDVKRIAIKGSTDSNSRYIYLDDVSIVAPVDCAPVTSPTVGTVTYNSAQLSWTAGGSETNWKLQYRASGAGSWTTVNVSSANLVAGIYTLDGLSENTTYEWQVAAWCDTSDNDNISTYVAGEDFSTPVQFPMPTSLAANNISANSADITWTAGSTETAWQLYYTPYDYATPGSASPGDYINISTTHAYTMTGLTGNTTYYVYVRANYGEDHYSSWTDAMSFRTSVLLPYSYDFTDDTELNAWTLYNCHPSTGITVSGSNYYFHFNQHSSYNPQYLITPLFENSSNALLVSFDYKLASGTGEVTTILNVGYSTTNKESFTFPSSASVEVNSTSYQKLEYVFQVEGIKYIAVKFDRNGNYLNTDIDNISFTPIDKVYTGGSEEWNYLADWAPAGLPESTDDVYINNTITIPNTCTAEANNIIIGPSGSLTINDGGQLICNNQVSVTAKKSIEGWTVLNNNSGYLTDGWYFIASPLSEPYTPAAPMTSNTYDLFRLNPSTSMWENIKNSSHTDFTTLTNGRGYLYANSNTIDLEFTGTIKAYEASHDMTIDNGLNLIGNPFTYTTYVNCPFYRMNSAKNAVEGVEAYWLNSIAPCTGIIVEADGEGGTVTFSKIAPPAPTSGGKGNIQLELSQTVNHRGTNTTETLDNAIVSFNQGSELSKFYFGTQNANIYIPQNGKEFAIVSAGQEGQIPLNFRARVNGQYTLTFSSPLTSNLSSLTLIDNLTGAHVDLLQTPSYTFQGNTTDISARFRLMFTTTGVDENEDESQTDFAFISDGQLIVNGTGTLYVYDALGRQVSAKQVTPLTSHLLPLTSGVYVLQLVEGNSVRTQKIIVK